MTATCPSCGGSVSSAAKFCKTCRYPLQPAPLPPPAPPVAPARRRRKAITVMVIITTVILMVACCILAALSVRKALQSRASDPVSQSPTVESGPVNTAQPVVVDMVVPTAVSQGQPVVVVPTTVPVLPPSTLSSSLAAGQYDIVKAGDSGEHPNGEISYTSPYPPDCSGGCGSYNGILELRGIRVLDQGFVLDLEILVSEVSGDPWLFQSDLGRITLEINGQTFMPKASNFPAQVTSTGRMSGYLSFYDEIPLSEDTHHHVVMSIQNRLAQPIEGWLAPPSSP